MPAALPTVHLRLFRSTILSLFLVLLPSPARAGDAVDAATIDMARRHFQAGSAYFEEARYDDAVREFRESYRLAPRGDLLYNIAQCYVRKKDAARAIEFYAQYLSGRQDVPDRASVERTIEGLRAQVGQVRVEGATRGAEITVAGTVVGFAPLAHPERFMEVNRLNLYQRAGG